MRRGQPSKHVATLHSIIIIIIIIIIILAASSSQIWIFLVTLFNHHIGEDLNAHGDPLWQHLVTSTSTSGHPRHALRPDSSRPRNDPHQAGALAAHRATFGDKKTRDRRMHRLCFAPSLPTKGSVKRGDRRIHRHLWLAPQPSSLLAPAASGVCVSLYIFCFICDLGMSFHKLSFFSCLVDVLSRH